MQNKFGKPIPIRFSEDIEVWLDEKVAQGFNKAALIRRIVSDYKNAEAKKIGVVNGATV